MTDEIAGRCSRCHENTVAELDPYEKEPRTVCCWAPLLPDDWEPPTAMEPDA